MNATLTKPLQKLGAGGFRYIASFQVGGLDYQATVHHGKVVELHRVHQQHTHDGKPAGWRYTSISRNSERGQRLAAAVLAATPDCLVAA